MNVLIFEDENHTATRLANLLAEIDNNINIVRIISSVKEGVEWFRGNKMPDLIFQDIILSDGNCFDIFNAVDITAPVIFTTAFSKYALRSFQVNSIDYIVKPYDKKDIEKALDKFKRMKGAFAPPEKALLQEILNKETFTPKRRFLIKSGDNYNIINSSEIAYFISEESVTFAVLFSGKRHIVDHTIAELSELMDPEMFFQISRKTIVSVECVEKISSWFNSRLKLQLNPQAGEDIIVSRERVKDFKEWLDR
ncbi:MAG: response regulator transcription factor [Chlorobi bacterium]|nr:response regulator transcription factor [Chlorobiota bacterium]